MEDWEVLEGYAGDKQGYYQVLGNEGSVEVRVAIGRLGFRNEFDKKSRACDRLPDASWSEACSRAWRVYGVAILVRFDHYDYSGDCQFTQLSDSSFPSFVAYFD